MTTESLRKVMTVTAWSLTETGLTISYIREDVTPTIRHLVLSPSDTIQHLTVVGSLEEGSAEYVSGKIDGLWYSYPQIVQLYKMCQWEALSIALRHEEVKNLENDLNLLEIDAALDALKS
jgi:hypothetical protein